MDPEHIGNYRLLRLLGEGGMGRVFEAVHARLGRHVAIKVLHATCLRDRTLVQRFFNEARAASQIDHPGVVDVLEYDEQADGIAYLVMEFIKGESLAQRLQERRALPAIQALRIARQVAATLQVAHEKGIIHRDLKPDNIMLTPDPEVPEGERTKIVDFGIAKIATVPGSDGTLLRTATQTLMGTPLYMSPEQCRAAGQVDGQTDVYALGVIIYEMMTGTPPFLGQGMAEVLGLHLFAPPPPLPAGLQVPVEVERLLGRMLAKEPGARPTMAQLSAELDSLLRHQGRSRPELLPEDPTALMSAEALSRMRADAQVTSELEPVAGPARPPGPPLPVAPPAPAAMARRRWRVLTPLGLALGLGAATGSFWLWHAPRRGMVALGGGTFVMGSSAAEARAAYDYCRETVGEACTEEFYAREQPQRTVTLSPYLLDAREVTNAEFAVWIEAQGGVQLTEDRLVRLGGVLLADLYPSYGYSGVVFKGGHFRARPGYEQMPVVQVTWWAASRYCAALGKRLPTEAEWEFAARGAEGRRYPWGDGAPACARVVFGRAHGQSCERGGPGPTQVGEAPDDRTPEGVRDLGGNVSEWVQDVLASPYQPCPEPCLDPANSSPSSGEPRVVRGGNWYMPAESCRAAARSRQAPDQPRGNIGFRCARSRTLAALR